MNLTTMARPEKLPVAQLLKALTPTAGAVSPVKPSTLAKSLGVSRATVHRKLEALLTEGLVVREGEGPAAAYRLPTTQEALARAEVLRPDGQIRMVMDKRTAWAVREGLELYTRLGIGQLEEIRQDISMTQAGAQYPYKALERLSGLLANFKRTVLGLASNASFGVYNPLLEPSVTKAWALMRTLRHRLAWDQTPEGRMGVWHDEPLLAEDFLSGLVVHSDTPDSDGKPTRYIVEMPRECVELIGRAVKVALRVRTGDFGVLLDLAKDGLLRHHEGGVPSAEQLLEGEHLVEAMRSLLSAGLEPHIILKQGDGEERLQQVGQACERFAAWETNVGKGQRAQVSRSFSSDGFLELSTVTDSPFAQTVDDLPEGMMLNFKAGKYRVIAPRGDDELLTIIAESRSLQTAMQMARNVASGGPDRQWAI